MILFKNDIAKQAITRPANRNKQGLFMKNYLLQFKRCSIFNLHWGDAIFQKKHHLEEQEL